MNAGGIAFAIPNRKRRPIKPPSLNSKLELQNLYVLCLPALGPFDYAERDRLAFLQAAEAVGLNRRIVNEIRLRHSAG